MKRTLLVVGLIVAVTLIWWLGFGSTPGPEVGLITIPRGSGETVGTTEKTFRIIVVDRETRAPVAGAEVLWCEFPDQRALTSPEFMKFVEAVAIDAEAAWRRFGQKGRTDKNGVLVLRRTRDPSGFLARMGERYGEFMFDWRWTDAPIEIAISRDIGIDVVVTDQDGKPAVGVDVVAKPRFVGRAGRAMQLRTDVAGRVRFGHLQVATWSESPLMHIDFHCVIPGYKSPAIRLDADGLAAQRIPLAMTLPPTGRVDVQIVNDGGKPFLGRYPLTIVAAGEQSILELTYSETGAGGNYSFPYAMAGLRFEVSASSFDDWELGTATGGPVIARATTVVRVPIFEEISALRGRALDATGKPVASREIFLRSESDSSYVDSSLTDEDGYFLFAPDVIPRNVRILLAGDYGDGPALVADRALENPAQDGVNRLGDVRFAIARPVVEGSVTCDGAVPRGFDARRLFVEGFDASRPPGEEWQEEDRLVLNWRSAGSFEFLGVTNSSRMRIKVRADDYLPVEPLEFRPGATDARILLHRGAEVRARVVVGAKVDSSCMRLELRLSEEVHRVSGARRNYAWYMDTVGEDGWFEWPAVVQGRYDLYVYLTGRSSPLVRIADLEVPATGKRCNDARLALIDLTGTVRTIKVNVTDDRGKAISSTILISRPGGGGSLEGPRAPESGVTILTAEPAVDLWVIASGYVDAKAWSVDSDTTIEMQKMDETTVPVWLQPALTRGLPPDVAFSVRFESVPSDTTPYTRFRGSNGSRGMLQDLRRHGDWCGFSNKRPARVTLRADVEYEVTLFLGVIEVERPRQLFKAEGRFLESLRGQRPPLRVDAPPTAIQAALEKRDK